MPDHLPDRMSAAGQPRPQNIPLGIGLMLLSMFLFSLNDVLGKWLVGTYSPAQMLLLRSLAALAMLAPLLRRVGWRALVTVDRPRVQLVRAVLSTLETALFYFSVRYLPLADATTFYLAGPIYVTVMAAVFLREPVGWRRWAAVLAGFAGVVVASVPSASSFGWPVLIAVAGSITYAVFLVITRSLRGTGDVVMSAWQVISALIFGAVVTPFVWVTPAQWFDLPLLFLLGVAALVAIVFVNRSLALAPASIVVPYQYTMIVWAVIFGFVVFHDTPKPLTLLGAAIIVAAGLVIYFREARLGRTVELEAPPER